MQKKLLSLIIFSVFIGIVQAQQPAQQSLYMFNPQGTHPAYSGLDNSIVAVASYRKQWSGLLQSPSTQRINVQMPLYYLSGGVGFSFENDKQGAERNLSATLAYAFHRSLAKNLQLSLAVEGGILQKKLDGNLLRAPDGSYEGQTVEHNDPQLANSSMTSTAPLLNAGLYLKAKKMEIGLTAQNLANVGMAFVNEDISFTLKRNYLMTFVTTFDLTSNVAVQPSILAKTDASATQIDFSVLFSYQSNIFAGATFRGYDARSIDALALIFAYRVSSKLTLHYGYDLTLSGLKSVSNGSHELMLRYDLQSSFGKGRLPKIIYNPRLL